MLTYSSYQLAIFEAVKAGKSNVLVNAVAGSGKSFSLEHALKHVNRGERIIALAFNKSIATELQKRIPDGAVASTLNSVGHRAWMAFAGRECQLESNKARSICQRVVPFAEREITADVLSLMQKAKVHGLVPNEAVAAAKSPVRGLMEDTDQNWIDIADRYGISLPWQYGRVLQYARSALAQSVTRTSVIDFDDQLYMSVIYGVSFQSFDRILVDEAQDLSDIQIEMIKRMGTPKTRYLFVGDRRQSLYAFRGADSKAMDRIKTEFSCQELPLSVTYRCPKLVVDVARKYEPTIEPRPGAPEGVVRDGGYYMDADYRAGDMVVCRRTLPVITLAYGLIGRRVKCRVQGRDLAEGLKSLLRKLKATSVEDLLKRIDDWQKRQVDLLIAAEEEHKIEQVSDKANTLRIVITSSGARTIADVENEIEGLFSGDGPCVLLSTVHRAKGLQAERVFVIDNDFTPKYALTNPEQMEQEQNIKYVAVTRAQQELVFVSTQSNRKGTKTEDQAKALGTQVESLVGAAEAQAVYQAPIGFTDKVLEAKQQQLLLAHNGVKP